jgi:hypothetical protein
VNEKVIKSYGSGLATHMVPESCGAAREGGVEALTRGACGPGILALRPRWSVLKILGTLSKMLSSWQIGMLKHVTEDDAPAHLLAQKPEPGWSVALAWSLVSRMDADSPRPRV